MTTNNITPDTDTDTEVLVDTEVLDIDTSSDEVEFDPGTNVNNILNELEMMADDFSDHIQSIRLMQENGFFKYASKECRNKLLDGMLTKIDDLDETTKVAFRALKRVKRERVPDKIVDTFLISGLVPVNL